MSDLNRWNKAWYRRWLTAAAAAAAIYGPLPPRAIWAAAQSAPTPGVSHRQSSLIGYTISKVEIVGATPHARKLIQNQIRVVPGESYDEAEVSVDVRSIASLGLFYSVEAQIVPQQHHRLIVRYVVKQRRVLKRVEFQGNRHVRTKTLKDLVLSHAGKPIDPFYFRTDIKATGAEASPYRLAGRFWTAPLDAPSGTRRASRGMTSAP